ncbi:DUF4129 domain-containing protein [Cohnella fermenti]|uniref:DUF4129 domain-containing protein n=1 Tax=Cohnella fermenti TaxID=2565925 RepID=A0A4S4C4W4_9BACL|nr:DUF4129 domain-containing protein [Cohnella fermenti]THF82214.1 DUF4129 domain-containing protein [Cohnella fermenti]
MKGNAFFAAVPRAIGQWLAWLPAAAALAVLGSFGSIGSGIAAALAAALFGALLASVRRMPSWLAYAALLAAIALVFVRLGAHWTLPILYWGGLAWASRRSFRPAAIPAIGIATNGIALMAVYWEPELGPYRALFIVSGIVWFVVTAFVVHNDMMDSAGLHDGIVTRIVSRASRRYLALLLAAVLIVYLLTGNFHLWSIIKEFLREHWPKSSPAEPEPSASLDADTPSFPALPEASPPGAWTKWLDYGMYALGGVIGGFLIWLIAKKLLLNRAWWREVAARLSKLLSKLLQRREPPPAPAYVDEKESLLDIGKSLRQAQSRWLRRGANKPIGRTEWEKLTSREKVRRLYLDSVLLATEAGYKPRASDTPAEALEAIERWDASRPSGGPAKGASGNATGLGGWLRQARLRFAELYGRVRYADSEATPDELAKLSEEYPWDSRRWR